LKQATQSLSRRFVRGSNCAAGLSRKRKEIAMDTTTLLLIVIVLLLLGGGYYGRRRWF
jgi:LPXTG-motif cell wall-anchored protein